MAIKLVANYSKRLGLPGYSSHQFSVSVETELRDLAEADTEMSNLYHQLQRNVDAQIQETGFVPSESYGSQSSQRQAPPQNTQPQPRANPSTQSDQWRCSDKQQQFIHRLMNENNLPLSEVDHLARQRFGIAVSQLNKMQASGLIDELLDQYGSKGKGGSR
ncbi:MAG: hypothetical protein P1U90_16275 [Akkermansiaceae bacterium]|nr:hypothetical protein [Akkermansiaceae bacterium]